MRELPGDAQAVRLMAGHALAVNAFPHIRERLRRCVCPRFDPDLRRLWEKHGGRAFKLVIDVGAEAAVEDAKVGASPDHRAGADGGEPERHRGDLGGGLGLFALHGSVDFRDVRAFAVIHAVRVFLHG